MWRATGRTTDGKSVDVSILEIGELQSRDQLLSEARRFLPPLASIDTFARELEAADPLPGIDAIERWGEIALALFGPPELGAGLEYGRVAETASGREIRGLSWVFLNDRTVAFHLPEAIVVDVTGLEDINIVGEADVAAPPDVPVQLFLEWRAYLGTGTLIAEGEAKFDEVVAPTGSMRKATIWLKDKVGILVGRILCIMGKPPRSYSIDPSFHHRLRHYEERLPEIAKAYPDLRTWAQMPVLHAAPAPGPMIIFVHGTFSCTMPNLALLHPLRAPTFRFEHDTFGPITENAEELANAVTKLLQPAPLHLIAHSRGGLVARLAARKLSKRCQVIVRTYGTPHLGTPLANAGNVAWSALLAMGRTLTGGIFSWDPASLVVKLFFRSSDLPPGLSVMKTDSDTLRSWTFAEEPFELISHGGMYEKRGLPNGASAYTFGERVLHEALGESANDLVVPTASALGAGKARAISGSCDHFSYFARREVLDELRGL
jgi:hypothetical protein